LQTYVAKTPSRILAEATHVEAPEYDHEATRSQACDASLGTAFCHMLDLGEAQRVARSAGDDGLAAELDGRLSRLAAELEREAGMTPLPLRSLVAMQAGAGLLTLSAGAD
jgi:hypothetical protein